MVRHMRYIISTLQIRSLSGLSYYHNPGSEPLGALTIGQLLDNAADKWPDRRAFVSKHENKTLTFAQARDQANQLAASLLKLGLKPGDRIAALGATSTNWYLSMLAAAKAGLILAGINPAFRHDELKYTFNKVGVKAIITDFKFKSQLYYEILSELAPELTKNNPSQPLQSKSLPDLQYIIVSSDENLPGAYRYTDIYGLADNLSQLMDVSKAIQPDQPCNIQYTSGTTGHPKAVTLTHFGLINNGYSFAKNCGFHQKKHTVCLQVPLFHVFGSVLGVLGANLSFFATLIVPGPAYNLQNTFRVLKEEECTALYGTPTMHIDFCSAAEEAFKKDHLLEKSAKNIDLIVSGGSFCPPELFKKIAKTFDCEHVQTAYGMSETCCITFTNTINDSFKQRSETVGHVLDHTEVKIVDSEGEMVPFGTPGEVWFRGYSIMLGYWNDADKTKECLREDRWLKSGDLMVLTEDGYGKIIGRKKEIIIRGGENILPSEVENLLLTHPKIVETYVFGVHDERLGEEVAAAVGVKPGETITEGEIKEFCKDKISKFKIPKYIRVVEEFPKTASGKIKRHVLKETLEVELKAEANQNAKGH